MIKIGEYNSLEVIKETNFGFYLGEKDGNEEILIPKGNIIDTLEVGDIKKFFVYRDSEDRPVATMKNPVAKVGDIASLKVV